VPGAWLNHNPWTVGALVQAPLRSPGISGLSRPRPDVGYAVDHYPNHIDPAMLKQCRKFTVKPMPSGDIAAGGTPPVHSRAAADATGTVADSIFLSAA
jgi:hypothetical protein